MSYEYVGGLTGRAMTYPSDGMLLPPTFVYVAAADAGIPWGVAHIAPGFDRVPILFSDQALLRNGDRAAVARFQRSYGEQWALARMRRSAGAGTTSYDQARAQDAGVVILFGESRTD